MLGLPLDGEMIPRRIRDTFELAAFRRNGDVRAAQLRSDLQVALARLAAEVPGAALELGVATGDEGVVRVGMAVESDMLIEELLAAVSVALEPIAELEATPCDDEVVWWPRQEASGWVLASLPPVVHSSWPGRPILWTSLPPISCRQSSPTRGWAFRVRLQAAARPSPGRRPSWIVTLAVTTKAVALPLALRAEMRTQFPDCRFRLRPVHADRATRRSRAARAPVRGAGRGKRTDTGGVRRARRGTTCAPGPTCSRCRAWYQDRFGSHALRPQGRGGDRSAGAAAPHARAGTGPARASRRSWQGWPIRWPEAVTECWC
jgi:hypothetical protein